jgi:hypothetical protein
MQGVQFLDIFKISCLAQGCQPNNSLLTDVEPAKTLNPFFVIWGGANSSAIQQDI